MCTTVRYDHDAHEHPTTQTDAPPVIDASTPFIRRMLAGCIRLYQNYISPLTPPSCRFYPTCSEYARRAIVKHGAVKGMFLGIKRLLKCHPFHPGGFDPVP